MKIVLSRDEIRDLIKEKYGLTGDFLLEISTENSAKIKIEAESDSTGKEPEVEYDIKVDENGFITDMTPKDKKFVPFTDYRGRTFNYENKCKVCGKTFYTMTKPADVCSADCLKIKKKEATSAKKITYTLKCKQCGVNFTSNSPSAKYCSGSCKELAAIQKAEKSDKSMKKKASKSGGRKSTIDYTIYAIKIEDFLNSDQDSVVIEPVEGITAAGTRDRYKVAATLFDLRDKVALSYNSKTGLFKMKRKQNV